MGLQVTVADSGSAALALVEHSPTAYHVILMDIQMPDMDGLETTRRLRAMGVTIPIVAMTAHAFREDRERALEAGMNDHIPKRIEPEKLYLTLRHWLPPSPVISSKPATSDFPGIDYPSAMHRMGNNRELFLKLLGMFKQECPTLLQEIEHLLTLGDLAKARAVVHKLKGASGNLSAKRIWNSAAQLEDACKQEDRESAWKIIPEVRAAIEEVCGGKSPTSPFPSSFQSPSESPHPHVER